MCNCRATLQDPKTWTDNKTKEKATSAIIDSGLAEVDGVWLGVTTSRLEIYFPSRKKPAITSVGHTYCPWCGTKYGSKEEVEAEPLTTDGNAKDNLPSDHL